MDEHRDKRSIAVFTGSRAEYGLLRHLIAMIAADPDLNLQLIVSGGHLSVCNGSTKTEIEADGHQPAALVPLALDQTPPPSMAALSGEALTAIAQALERLQPELMIVLGDRYEAFAAAAAAHLLGIPIVHLHGGETTSGAVDDRLRHAITQLSTWHFTAAEPYRQRVIAMGHPPEQVFNVGPIVLDALISAENTNRSKFERSTGYRFGPKNLLITYHPETLLKDRGIAGFQNLLKALEGIRCHVLFTHPNADTGRDRLLELLEKFLKQHPGWCWAVPSLGQERYLEALQLFEGVAGNSSSGVIEAPLVGIPVLNIGRRQAGRLSHKCVYHTEAETNAITDGLLKVIEQGTRSSWPRRRPQIGNSPGATVLRWLKTWSWAKNV